MIPRIHGCNVHFCARALTPAGSRRSAPSLSSLSVPWVCFNASVETLPQRSEFVNVTYHSTLSTISHYVPITTASLAQFLGLFRSV